VLEDARLVEALGYDGRAVEETKVDPYVVMALAVAGTTRLRLTTATDDRACRRYAAWL